MMNKLIGLTALVTLGAGCAASTGHQETADDPSTKTSEEQPDFDDIGDPNETFSQTRITVKEDGSVETHSSTITRGEQWQLRREDRNSQRSHQRDEVEWHSETTPQFRWSKVTPNPISGVCNETGLLVLWDAENYVGNQVCFSYAEQWAFDQQSGQWIQLFSPGLDMANITRGALELCGYHKWYEATRECVYSGGTWQWATGSPLVYLQAASAKNNSTGPAIFSTSPSRNAGTNTTLSAGTQHPSLFMIRRYLKALP